MLFYRSDGLVWVLIKLFYDVVSYN